MIIALAYLVNTVSSYLGIDLPILASIAGMSLIPLVFMYISSYVFRFCEYHRIFLHYIAINDIINIYENHIWHFIGYRPQRDNDEVDAYLITYIYNKIVDVFYKHDRAAR